MRILTLPSFDKHVEELHALARRASSALASAGIRHRIVGGFAVFIHVENRDPIAARLTRDVDMAVPRSELARIAEAARTVGFELRHVAGVDLLVDRANPSARKAVHLVFFDEKVRPEYPEPVPAMEQAVLAQHGLAIATVRDLVWMKLTSFRDKDRVHIRDLDGVGLVTPEIEASLSPVLRERLAHIRATE